MSNDNVSRFPPRFVHGMRAIGQEPTPAEVKEAAEAAERAQREYTRRVEAQERIRLARDLYVSTHARGAGLSVEQAFKLADEFADAALVRLPHGHDGITW